MKLLQYFLKDDGRFPNSHLPVLVYKKGIRLPLFFKAQKVRKLFSRHHWTNNWRNGVYTFHHYHSNTHEVMGVIRGSATIKLGGEDGLEIRIEKGDVILIPAGVAHKNMGREKDVICVGGYPQGKDYDINTGTATEYAKSVKRIKELSVPLKDPVFGKQGFLKSYWK